MAWWRPPGGGLSPKERAYRQEKLRRHLRFLNRLRRHPCKDCRQKYPTVCMQFDHVPRRGPKKYDLAAMAMLSRESVLRELRKCDVVCANCHAKRTARRRRKK